MAYATDIRVWRYMSFAKLVWTLQRKQLWLTRAELLDDKWEVMLATEQLNALMTERQESGSPDDRRQELAEAVAALRRKTYVNCWTASAHESHALWRLYCPSNEGVAIQTRLDRLKASVGLPLLEVAYGPHEEIPLSDIRRIVAQKRPMFAYEREVRIVLVRDLDEAKHPDRTTIGAELNWDPEEHLEMVWVHPEAPVWFMEAVTRTVHDLAPAISHEGRPLVAWSQMNTAPPL